MSTSANVALSVYKTKPFSRFARKAHIRDEELWEAARRASQGSVDADLGGGVIKQRIARAGEGKSGGSRAILLYRIRGRVVFVYGFEKKDKANISDQELAAFRELADVILGYNKAEMAQRVAGGALIEIAKPEESGDGR